MAAIGRARGEKPAQPVEDAECVPDVLEIDDRQCLGEFRHRVGELGRGDEAPRGQHRRELGGAARRQHACRSGREVEQGGDAADRLQREEGDGERRRIGQQHADAAARRRQTGQAEAEGEAAGDQAVIGERPALDVVIVLFLQNKGFRYVEALVVTLILTIGVCFFAEIIFSRPDVVAVLGGFLPKFEIVTNPKMLFIAMGILGATVMPHNLYLHSSIVQTRKYEPTPEGRREAIKFATIDSTVALMFALFINAAILIVSAASFYGTSHNVAEIQDAHRLLSPVLGVSIASTVFAVALLASGQNSTLTGTLAGQIVMEGFLNIRLRPWLRRLITRLIAIIPAVIVTALYGESKTTDLLVLSQVILSLQLPFAVVPLVLFTSDRRKMGEFASSAWVKILAWITAAIIIVLNVKLLADTFGITALLTGAKPE